MALKSKTASGKTLNLIAGREVTTSRYRLRHNSMKTVVAEELNSLQKEKIDMRTQRMKRVVREVLRITDKTTREDVSNALKQLGYIS